MRSIVEWIYAFVFSRVELSAHQNCYISVTLPFDLLARRKNRSTLYSGLSDNMSEEDDRAKRAAEIFLNGRKGTKVPSAMKLAGFSEDESKNRTSQMRVRRIIEKLKANSHYLPPPPTTPPTSVMRTISPTPSLLVSQTRLGNRTERN